MPKRRQVECPHCKKALRLAIKENSFGREIEVTCSSCGGKFRTTIPDFAEAHEESFRRAEHHAMEDEDQQRLQPLVEEFGTALYDAIVASSRLHEIVEKIRSVGYNADLMFDAILCCGKRDDAEAEIHEPTPLVENGEVVPGAFSDEDKNWMKKYRINFEK